VYGRFQSSSRNVSLTQFLRDVDTGKVETISIHGDEVVGRKPADRAVQNVRAAWLCWLVNRLIDRGVDVSVVPERAFSGGWCGVGIDVRACSDQRPGACPYVSVESRLGSSGLPGSRPRLKMLCDDMSAAFGRGRRQPARPIRASRPNAQTHSAAASTVKITQSGSVRSLVPSANTRAM
jgi:hypothetical protein